MQVTKKAVLSDRHKTCKQHFSVLTLPVRSQTGHLACKKLCHLSAKAVFQNKQKKKTEGTRQPNWISHAHLENGCKNGSGGGAVRINKDLSFQLLFLGDHYK